MENKVKAKAPESFFSKLRHLAGEVDTKVQSVKENLTFKKSFPEQDQDYARANFFLANTRKETTKEFQQVKAKFNEFELNNVKFRRIQDLIQSMLSVHEQRSEKLLNYLECYGYVKAAIDAKDEALLQENIQVEQSNEDNDLLHNSVKSAEDLPENELISNSHTPQSKTNAEQQFVRRTPKLEDHGQLSEYTISFFKGSKSHSDVCDFDTEQTSSLSAISLFDKTRPADFISTDQLEAKKTFLNEKYSGDCSFLGKKHDVEDCYSLLLNNQRFADITLTGTEIPKEKEHSFSAENKFLYGKHLSSTKSTQIMMKLTEHRKSPVFNDVYGMLSEVTKSLFKHTSNKSVSAENLSEKHMSTLSDSFRDSDLHTELNSSLKPNDKSLSESSLCHSTPAMCSSLNKYSNTASKTNAMTQDTHTFDLSELQQNAFLSEYNQRNPKCARSLLYAGTNPPAKEIPSTFTSSYPYASAIGKENLPATKAFDALPEPPKLLSTALIEDLYNNKY